MSPTPSPPLYCARFWAQGSLNTLHPHPHATLLLSIGTEIDLQVHHFETQEDLSQSGEEMHTL